MWDVLVFWLCQTARPSSPELLTSRYIFNVPCWDSYGCFSSICSFRVLLSDWPVWTLTRWEEHRDETTAASQGDISSTGAAPTNKYTNLFLRPRLPGPAPSHDQTQASVSVSCLLACVCTCYSKSPGAVFVVAVAPALWLCLSFFLVLFLVGGCLNINSITKPGLISLECSVDGRSVSAVIQR